jgi:aspartate/methionine/tyrosine aminotransferase
MKFNKQLKKIIPSASMKNGLSNKSSQYNLAIGSPDITPPQQLLNIERKPVSYFKTKGSIKALEVLHEVVFNKSLSIDPEKNISLCNGAKFGIYLSLKTITNPGDHVMLLQPYWLSYPDICTSLHLQWSSEVLNIKERTYSIENLQKSLLKNKSKVLIINNPNNPGGFVLHKEFLSEITRFCQEHHIWVLLDEVYKDLNFNGNRLHETLDQPNLIKVGSLSKSLAVPGLRIGYVAGDDKFISAFNLFNQHISTCINSISNEVVENINPLLFDDFTQKCQKIYEERYHKASQILLNKGYSVLESQASFYILVKVTPKYTDVETCINYLAKEGIIVTPGVNYGVQFSDYIRICLTLPTEELVSVLLKF